MSESGVLELVSVKCSSLAGSVGVFGVFILEGVIGNPEHAGVVKDVEALRAYNGK